MSPVFIIHWINYQNNLVQLIDNFQYDEDNNPIIPDNNFVWIDINNVKHIMYDRDGMSPLVYNESNIINYFW